MNEPKPFASLSSGLLARKGTARPAMRPQGIGQFGAGIEDLGWNDMGHAPAPKAALASSFEEPHQDHVPSPISALTPMNSGGGGEEEFSPAPPIVEQQRAAIAASFADSAEEPFVLATKVRKAAEEMPLDQEPEAAAIDEVEDVPVAALPDPVGVKAIGPARSKAAFTLRLEADRHLKLRLACAVTGQSAQQLVTEALDRLLQSRPEIGALAQQVPAHAGKPS